MSPVVQSGRCAPNAAAHWHRQVRRAARSLLTRVRPRIIPTCRVPCSAGSTLCLVLSRIAHLPSLSDTFYFFIVGPDQKMVTKRPSHWSPGQILVAFCTICRARPVGTGLGAKFGRKPANKQMKTVSLIAYRSKILHDRYGDGLSPMWAAGDLPRQLGLGGVGTVQGSRVRPAEMPL